DWLRDNGFTGVVMLVGHEPNLSALASCLLTGDGRLALDFRKGAVCRIDMNDAVAAGHGTLRWFLTQSQLRKLRER
ncbi:MAG: phosphohistidine phosphatase SixA, partial [Chromatiales bacterium]|nr:phosphohistidine phosphatase SixA [Chromatiales bacterium]